MRSNDGTRTGGEILIDQLVIQGVKHVFCVPGESYLAALDAFYGSPIAITVCRHESGAAMMAEAVGKTTGKPGICFVTRGPGATNASAGIHIARQDSSPMIMFVGQVGRHMRDREAFQELDYRDVFGGLAKWATEIDDPARIPEIVSRAFHTACNGRPGPVVIALPEDMLTERAMVPNATAFEPVEIWPGLTDMSRLQKMLWAAKRPIAVIGGSRWSEAACCRHDAVCRTLCTAGRDDLPRAAFVRRAASLLRRRFRHRAQSEIAGAREGRRSRAADRRPHERDVVAKLYGLRHSRTADEAGARASGLGRTRPRLSSGAGDQRVAFGVLRVARRVAAAERDRLEGRERHRACRLYGVVRKGDGGAGRRQSRRDHGVAAREPAGRFLHYQRRRQFRHLDQPLLSLPQIRHAGRADFRARWVTDFRPRLR